MQAGLVTSERRGLGMFKAALAPRINSTFGVLSERMIQIQLPWSCGTSVGRASSTCIRGLNPTAMDAHVDSAVYRIE